MFSGEFERASSEGVIRHISHILRNKSATRRECDFFSSQVFIYFFYLYEKQTHRMRNLWNSSPVRSLARELWTYPASRATRRFADEAESRDIENLSGRGLVAREYTYDVYAYI